MIELWAKDTGETLFEHIDNVVTVSEKICKRLPFPERDRLQLASISLNLALMHDLGKAATGFQDSLRKGKRWGHRHEVISAAAAHVLIPELSQEALLAILTHHRSIPESITTVDEKCLPIDELPYEDETPVWDQMTQEWLNNWEAVRYLLSNMNNIPDLVTPLKFGFSGLGLPERILHRSYQQKTPGFNRHLASLLRGLLITSDHMASAHQLNLPVIPVHKDFIASIQTKEIKGNKVLPFQARCGQTEGDAILKAPTGSGKTAAILLWAANNQVENGRLFYVLPHTASINAMHKRLQNIYGEKSVGVLHHKNAAYLFRIFENEYPSHDAARMAQTISGLARELYYPIRVTTPHQILRVALKGKGWEIGLAEFPNACFVFDEIHAFEPLLVGLTIATVKWLKTMGAKVLFASATLPLFLEKILQDKVGTPLDNIILPDPRREGDKGVLDKTRHAIEIRKGCLLSNIETIIDEIETSQKTALIICNHVATSQAVYKKVKNAFQDVKLLHARFNAEDRFKIEEAIQSKNPPRVLVATQAVEVSLDLDYDCGYIEPAPADALGQRLGRINRKGSRPKPAHVVIFEEPSKTARGTPLYLPYDENITQRTIGLLDQIKLLSEQKLTDIVDEIYGDGYIGDSKEDYERGLNNQMIEKFTQEMIAGTYRHWIEDVIEGSDGQIEVLPMELYNKFIELRKEEKYLEAKLLLVPIQSRQIKRLFREGILYWDKQIGEYKTSLEYSSDYGLDLSKQMENLF